MSGTFKIIYWLGLLLQIAIRAPFQKNWRSGQKTEQRGSWVEQALLGLLTLGGMILPLVYSVTPWLEFANITLPDWAGWLGVIFLASGLYLFARGHIDLKSNWSPTLVIFENHTLVTQGIYRLIRHPMYASQWLFSIEQLLLLQNWIAGPAGLIAFIAFYIFRVRAEEKLMLDTFGEEYRQYMHKTGSVFPKL